MPKIASFALFLSLLSPAYSQQAASSTATPVAPSVAPLNHRRLAPESAYARVYAIVPIVGSGTLADPKRPMFAPAPAAAATPANRSGIIAYQFQTSDDGNSALVEFVTISEAGLAPILSSTSPNVVFFERGKHTRQEIETAFRKYKKNFTFDKFMPVRAL